MYEQNWPEEGDVQAWLPSECVPPRTLLGKFWWE